MQLTTFFSGTKRRSLTFREWENRPFFQITELFLKPEV